MKKYLFFVLSVFALVSLIALAGCMEENNISDKNEKETVLVKDTSNNMNTYTIVYYPDIDSTKASSNTTMAITGEKTKLLTIEELGFSKQGYGFIGWRLYREKDDKWLLRNNAEKRSEWCSLEGGKLPEGYSYDLRKDGSTLTKPTRDGLVRLYAQWGRKYVIEYYSDIDSSTPSEITTEAVRGVWTDTETIDNLSFSKKDYDFVGWRLWREIDDKWLLVNEEGESGWYKVESGNLPEGYSYDYRQNGGKLRSPTKEGLVRLYAEWSNNEGE